MPEMKLPIMTAVFYINLCQKNKNYYERNRTNFLILVNLRVKRFIYEIMLSRKEKKKNNPASENNLMINANF